MPESASKLSFDKKKWQPGFGGRQASAATLSCNIRVSQCVRNFIKIVNIVGEVIAIASIKDMAKAFALVLSWGEHAAL